MGIAFGIFSVHNTLASRILTYREVLQYKAATHMMNEMIKEEAKVFYYYTLHFQINKGRNWTSTMYIVEMLIVILKRLGKNGKLVI